MDTWSDTQETSVFVEGNKLYVYIVYLRIDLQEYKSSVL